MKIDGLDTPIPGGLKGGLLLGKDGAFYAEVASTFGPKVLTCASDGQALAVLLSQEGLYAEDLEAGERLRELSEGLVGLSEVGALLGGHLPPLDAPVIFESRTDSGLAYEVMGGGGASVALEIDPGSLLVTQMVLRNTEEVPSVIMRHTPGDEVEGVFLPSTTVLETVATGLKLTLDFSEWQALDSSPVPFTLSAPDGVAVLSLEELSERLSATRKD